MTQIPLRKNLIEGSYERGIKFILGTLARSGCDAQSEMVAALLNDLRHVCLRISYANLLLLMQVRK